MVVKTTTGVVLSKPHYWKPEYLRSHICKEKFWLKIQDSLSEIHPEMLSGIGIATNEPLWASSSWLKVDTSQMSWEHDI